MTQSQYGALVIGRNLRSTVVIGDIIKVTVVKNDGQALKIKVEAPRVLEVSREEVYAENTTYGKLLHNTSDLAELTRVGSLVINRKPDTSLILIDIIKLKVYREGDALRLRIEAPKDIAILREEIHQPTVSYLEALNILRHIHKRELASRGIIK